MTSLSRTPPSWQSRLAAFTTPPTSRDDVRVGHVLYLAHSQDSATARASIRTMLGISESPEVNSELSRKIARLKDSSLSLFEECRRTSGAQGVGGVDEGNEPVRIAENLGVIEAGMYHRDLLVYIDECIDSLSKFFSGECPTLTTPPSFTLFKEECTLLQALIDPSPSPLACNVAVRVLRVCAEYLRDVLSQTMSGGEYSNPSSEVASAIESAPPTNRAVESAFAYMDYLYHKSPFARFFRRDAHTYFVLNHVSRWLDGKNTRERSIILEKAFECIKEIVYEEREKTEQLGEAIVSKMKARKVEEDGKAQKSEARKSRIVDELGGVLLTSSAEIDRAVFGLGQSNAINLIKAQLRFRKNVCKQKAEPRLYRFSAGKVVHGLNTLVANLKELVLADPSAGFIEEDDFHSSYLGRTCDLSTKLLFPDGTELSGQQKVLDIVLHSSGDSSVFLQGSSGVVEMLRSEFEDFVEDGVIFPLPF
ncbi:hypothetical protein PRIPAC_83152 [Pristionchus pacificus]|uniref:Uncharacterized protein n=1 Tax=Pristionchus pacificus TaxID=54126 RepID=A0A2A6BLP1_PRIPA|nr:hypothetical protein PRIPAC_83152 [Pristionchus pacificus]|eukprot:PDM66834.1 hypothetical protein PRIPAC_48251 [Pristionchus pacificus]